MSGWFSGNKHHMTLHDHYDGQQEYEAEVEEYMKEMLRKREEEVAHKHCILGNNIMVCIETAFGGGKEASFV